MRAELALGEVCLLRLPYARVRIDRLASPCAIDSSEETARENARRFVLSRRIEDDHLPRRHRFSFLQRGGNVLVFLLERVDGAPARPDGERKHEARVGACVDGRHQAFEKWRELLPIFLVAQLAQPFAELVDQNECRPVADYGEPVV